MAYSTMKSGIEQNKENTLKNRAYCKANEKNIRENKTAIEDLKRNSVPYVAFESAIARYDRLNRRLIIALILVVSLLFISNVAWIYAWNTWDNDATTVINKDGVSNYIGGDGIIDHDNS